MKQWYALRSKPRKEGQAATLLSRVSIETYLPQVPASPSNSGRQALVPFFPGYFFSRLDPDSGEIRLAHYTSGVLHVVGYGDQPWPVPDELVQTIRDRLARAGTPGAAERFKPGERVVITSGPLKDVEAIFDHRLSGSGRVQVLIRILQRLCPTEVRAGQIRGTDKAV